MLKIKMRQTALALVVHSLGQVLVAASVSLAQELLHLSLVFNTSLENEPAPVDAEDPPNDVHRGEHLHGADRQLSLAPSARVSKARHKHGADAGQDDVEQEADVRPGAAEARNLGHQIPELSILLAVLDKVGLGVIDALHRHFLGSFLVSLTTSVLLTLG